MTKAEQAVTESGYHHRTEQELAELSAAVEEARQALRNANNALNAAKQIYGREYNWMVGRAEMLIKQSDEYKAITNKQEQNRYLEDMRPTYVDRVLEMIQNSLVEPPYVTVYRREERQDGFSTIVTRLDTQDIQRYETAYNELAPNAPASKQKAADEAEKKCAAAVESYNQALSDNQEYQRLQQAVTAAEAAVEAAKKDQLEAQRHAEDLERDQTAAQEKLDSLGGTKSEYDAAQQQVKSAAQALDDRLFALAEKQKADGKTAQLDRLELDDMAGQIQRQKDKVAELDVNAAEKEVTAPVSGVVSAVSITAGQTTTPQSPMATIELPDMGYVLTATVPNEQARRVHTGDSASVANMYWGTQIDATLTGVKPDPKDPQNSKQLTFELTGDVTPGSNLTLSVGQKSAEYDFVVPNSALRSDTNGDFVLIVTAKNSPLGDRYTATRVNVTKVANDDTLTAVTGALNAGDFVITTSTAPIKNGDRVRLADSQS